MKSNCAASCNSSCKRAAASKEAGIKEEAANREVASKKELGEKANQLGAQKEALEKVKAATLEGIEEKRDELEQSKREHQDKTGAESEQKETEKTKEAAAKTKEAAEKNELAEKTKEAAEKTKEAAEKNELAEKTKEAAEKTKEAAAEKTKEAGEKKESAAVSKLDLKGKQTQQGSEGWDGKPERALDGNTDGNYGHNSCTHTQNNGGAWWSVDLGQSYSIQEVVVWNRSDCCHDRLNGVEVTIDSQPCGTISAQQQENKISCGGKTGSKINIKSTRNDYLTLCEVEVYEGDLRSSPVLSCPVLSCPVKNHCHMFQGCPVHCSDPVCQSLAVVHRGNCVSQRWFGRLLEGWPKRQVLCRRRQSNHLQQERYPTVGEVHSEQQGHEQVCIEGRKGRALVCR